jgi:hypothetical protein
VTTDALSTPREPTSLTMALVTAGATDLASDVELSAALSVLLNESNDDENDWAIENVCHEMAQREARAEEWKASHG